MPPLGRTDHRSRTLLLMLVLAAFAIAASVRLADWQVARGPQLREEAQAQLQRRAELATQRGRILDRNGQVLALTGYRDRLVAFPDVLADRDQTRVDAVEALTEMLGLSRSGRAGLEAQLADATSQYTIIDRQLTEEESAAIRAAITLPAAERKLYAVRLEPQAVRMYPNAGGEPGTTLASHLLGFVNAQGRGNYGVEQQYDVPLAGIPTKVEALRDPFDQLLGSSARVIEAGTDGVDVHLTIDVGLQLQLEKELYAAWVTDKAKRVSGVVMDPDTGAVLAWASVPGYDANDYAGEWLRRPTIFKDPIVGTTYEPGSVMKMFTAAAALDAKRVSLDKQVRDTVSLRFPPYTVRNADHGAMGWIPFRDVIAYSRNVATARTAANLARNVPKSSAVLYRMWSRLGIGQPTGIDLSHEEVGLVLDPAKWPWAPIDLANRSFGQGVSVTQLQLATGYTPMVNGGFRVTPHVLGRVGDEPPTTPARKRVLTPQVAGQLHSVLDHVTSAVPWYAAGSLIPDYQVGGKTGTAQIWMADKLRYSRDVFNFSFVGYVGGDEPAAIVTVRIEEARVTSRSQGDIVINLTSYQLFRRVAMDIIKTLDIPKASDPDTGFPEPLSAADEFLTPGRYEDHLRLKRRGVDLLAGIHDRYSPGAGRAARTPPTGDGATPAKSDRTWAKGQNGQTVKGRHDRKGDQKGTDPGTGQGGSGADGATDPSTEETSPDPSAPPGG